MLCEATITLCGPLRCTEEADHADGHRFNAREQIDTVRAAGEYVVEEGLFGEEPAPVVGEQLTLGLVV